MKKGNFILIDFKEKEKLISAFLLLKEKKFDITDVISPVPVEELNEQMPANKSYIGLSGFIFGLAGLLAVLYFQLWVSANAYPLIYGGKPYDVWLSYVPVLFESVVLLSALAIVITFLFEIKFSSGKYNLSGDAKFTNNHFALIVSLTGDIPEEERTFLYHNFNVQKI